MAKRRRVDNKVVRRKRPTAAAQAKIHNKSLQKQQQQQQQQRINNNNNTNSNKPSTSSRKQVQKQKQKHKQQQQHHQNQQPTIPFKPTDRILLVGEGDLSFAASIVRHHGCVNVTATVLERDLGAFVEKYPGAGENIAVFLGERDDDVDDGEVEEDEDGDDDDEDDQHLSDDNRSKEKGKGKFKSNNKILFNINAAKLTPSSLKSKLHSLDRIIFNFPHTGGKSTDINRQARHNQSLLVSFFTSALPLLRPTTGAIIVTLWEGEPYDLWNVRDLARHAGLGVDLSFRFVAGVYPGYRHVRTGGGYLRFLREDDAVAGAGAVAGDDSGAGADADTATAAASSSSSSLTRAEERRAARSYIFRSKDDVGSLRLATEKARKKRKRLAASDGSSDDDDGDAN